MVEEGHAPRDDEDASSLLHLQPLPALLPRYLQATDALTVEVQHAEVGVVVLKRLELVCGDGHQLPAQPVPAVRGCLYCPSSIRGKGGGGQGGTAAKLDVGGEEEWEVVGEGVEEAVLHVPVALLREELTEDGDVGEVVGGGEGEGAAHVTGHQPPVLGLGVGEEGDGALALRVDQQAVVGLQLSDEEEEGEAAAGDARLLVDAVLDAWTIEEDHAENVVHLQLGLRPILRRAAHTPQRPVRHTAWVYTDSEREGWRRRHQRGGRGGNEYHRRDQRETTMSFALRNTRNG